MTAPHGTANSPRRAAILREMGLAPLWRLRSRLAAEQQARAAATAAAPPQQSPATRPLADFLPAAAPPSPAPAAAGSTVRAALQPSATAQRPSGRAPQPATTRPAPGTAARTTDAAQAVTTMTAAEAAARAERIATLDWDALEADIRACRACALGQARRHAVPGTGDRQARWLFVGEGPGRDEDASGEAFVGAAGKLLDKMLAAIGLQRTQDVYIANAVKCRPPHNRIPEREELAACRPYLLRQLALLEPRLIFAMGRPAAHSLLGREVNISTTRGRIIEYQGQRVVVSYHPAYLLRNPQDKGKAWADLCLARSHMAAAAKADGETSA